MSGHGILLLLPLTMIRQKDTVSARKEIARQMGKYFPESLCERVSRCIVAGLAESGS